MNIREEVNENGEVEFSVSSLPIKPVGDQNVVPLRKLNPIPYRNFEDSVKSELKPVIYVVDQTITEEELIEIPAIQEIVDNESLQEALRRKRLEYVRRCRTDVAFLEELDDCVQDRLDDFGDERGHGIAHDSHDV